MIEERITKDKAFAFTLMDISEGCSLQEMREILTHYEELEEYEACAGIHLAIEVSSFLTLTAVTEEYFENNIELTFDEL